MKIKLIASLQGAGCIKFDDDGSAVIKLTIDGGQVANAVKMLALQGSAFIVEIDTEAR